MCLYEWVGVGFFCREVRRIVFRYAHRRWGARVCVRYNETSCLRRRRSTAKEASTWDRDQAQERTDIPGRWASPFAMYRSNECLLLLRETVRTDSFKPLYREC